MTSLGEKKLLSFAADTFLSFSLYSAFFLWTLCRDAGPSLLEAGEVEHAFSLMSGAATALESASLYPGDSPNLHASFVRSLIRTKPHTKSKHFGAYVSEPGSIGHSLAKSLERNAAAHSSPIDPSGLMSGNNVGGQSSAANVFGANTSSSGIPQVDANPNPSLQVLAQMQPAGSRPPPLSPGRQLNSAIPPWGATDFDSMLMADWNTMQKDVSRSLAFRSSHSCHADQTLAPCSSPGPSKKLVFPS